jgi:hypothetical protein
MIQNEINILLAFFLFYHGIGDASFVNSLLTNELFLTKNSKGWYSIDIHQQNLYILDRKERGFYEKDFEENSKEAFKKSFKKAFERNFEKAFKKTSYKGFKKASMDSI